MVQLGLAYFPRQSRVVVFDLQASVKQVGDGDHARNPLGKQPLLVKVVGGATIGMHDDKASHFDQLLLKPDRRPSRIVELLMQRVAEGTISDNMVHQRMLKSAVETSALAREQTHT